MQTKYIDLVNQTYDFPQEEFDIKDGNLLFHGIPMMDLVRQYGTPLRLTYLPKITSQIQRTKTMFNVAIAKAGYKGNYTFCYCTKSSHFSFVLEEALKNDIHLETSSAYDLPIIKKLYESGKLSKDSYVICNGYKRQLYIDYIADLVNMGFTNVVPVLDNVNELDQYAEAIDKKIQLGIRIAAEENPNFEFYTSRLGIRYKNVVPLYLEKIKNNPQFELKMLHFFINTGIRDNAYYWNELMKVLKVYKQLKQVCPELDSLNLGGGLPIKNTLNFNFDYEYIIEEVISQIQQFCEEEDIPVPHIFTEFGSFTVGESGATIFSVLGQKQQNDRELWYMIDNSIMTTLPDIWGMDQRFIMLPLNNWEEEYHRVFLGGLTCDSMDYYNEETNNNKIFLPKLTEDAPLFIGFFHTGAYQESVSGFGGIKHCLIPAPKHVIIDLDENGEYTTRLFAKEQSEKAMLKILGY